MLSDALNQLLDEFARSGVRELHIRKADFEVFLSTDPTASRTGRGPTSWVASPAPGNAPSPVPVVSQAEPIVPVAPAPAPAPSALPAGAIIVSAPNLGTFYRAPKPGAANYVEVGARVSAGDELCLIEVMKLFTAVRAEAAGTIHSVLVEDGAMVEGGQALFALVKD